MNVNEAAKELRLWMGLTQVELAKNLGITQVALSRKEYDGVGWKEGQLRMLAEMALCPEDKWYLLFYDEKFLYTHMQEPYAQKLRECSVTHGVSPEGG